MSDSTPTPEQPQQPPVPPQQPLPPQPPAPPAVPPSIAPAQPTPMSDSDQRLWSTLIHIAWLAGSFVGLPFLPAIIGYLVLKDRGGYIRLHTASALNFQLSWLIWGVALGVLSILTLGFGALLFIPFSIAYVVFTIIDAVKANRGEAPGNWLALPLVK